MMWAEPYGLCSWLFGGGLAAWLYGGLDRSSVKLSWCLLLASSLESGAFETLFGVGGLQWFF